MTDVRGTALVTGASSGIGLATVAALTADGWHVIATARVPERADDLRTLASGNAAVEVRQLDVTVADSVRACIAAVVADRGTIDLLVNNAGAGHRGTLEQLDDEELRRVLELNFLGVARTTREVIPTMRVRRAGRIITVTSTNGIIGMPFSDAYNASKFAVEGLMEGLAPVLTTFGVYVSVLEPGPVRTAFLRNTGGRVTDVDPDDPYVELLTRYNGTMAGLMGAGESAVDVGGLIAAIAREAVPHFRYQSSPVTTGLAARKLVDPTGDSVVAATSAFLQQGA